MKQLSVLLFVSFMSHVHVKCSVPNVYLKAERYFNDAATNSNIGFVENLGQVPNGTGRPSDFVLFQASADGIEVSITRQGISYIFYEFETEKEEHEKESGRKKNIEVQWIRTDLVLEGAVISENNLIREWPSEQGVFNYYLPHCPNGVLGAKTYRKIKFINAYPNIDWVLYATAKGIKYDFVVHPGGDPSQIKFRKEGAGSIKKLSKKKIQLRNRLNKLEEGELYSYQQDKAIPSEYIVQRNYISYKINNYDTSKDLVIDPPLQVKWATFYGGRGLCGPKQIVMDKNQFLYIGGYLSTFGIGSVPFPVYNPGAGALYQATMLSGSAGFIVKFDTTGKRIWATCYSGSGGDEIDDIALDQNNNLFVMGYTYSNNLPTMDPGGGAYFQSSVNGNSLNDLFIAKFSPGGALIWGTLFGGTNGDDKGMDAFYGGDIETDGQGNVYICGSTFSADFPLLDPGGGAYFQPAIKGPGNTENILAKFSNTGVLVWSTYLGGSGYESSNAMAVDATNNLFITGYSSSSDFPTKNLAGAFNKAAISGTQDAFVLKFNSSGILQWGTFYGGSGEEQGNYITADNTGNIYISGSTNSSNFPTKSKGAGAYYQSTIGAPSINDAFILQFNSAGTDVWSTYMGGSSSDLGNCIYIAPNGEIFTTGETQSNDFPIQNLTGSYFKNTNDGANDVYITNFSPSGLYQWGTYYGGIPPTGGVEKGISMLMATSGCLFVTGEWSSSTVYTANYTGAYFQSSNLGQENGFMLKLCPSTTLNVVANKQDNACKGQNNGKAWVTVTGNTGVPTVTWNSIPPQAGDTAYGLLSGTYMATVVDGNDTAKISVTINDPASSISADTITPKSICAGDSIAITATAAGGSPSYSFTWSPSSTLSSSSGATVYAKPTSTEIYSVVMTDQNGCTDSTEVLVNVLTATIAQVSGNRNICTGDTVILTATGGSIYSWQPSASLNNNNISSPVASPSATTTYTVTVSSSNCPPDTAQVTVFVSSSIMASAGNPSTICKGNSIVLSASGGSSYSWSPSTGLSSINISNPIAAPTSTTTYTVVVSSSNCPPDTDSVTITVLPQLIAMAGNDTSICLGETIQLNGSGGNAYSWNPSASLNNSSISNPIASPTISTTYTLSVSASGCPPDSDYVKVNVLPLPSVILGGSISIKSGESITLNAGISASSYSWQPSTDLNCSNCQKPIASPKKTTTYYLLVTDSNGCTSIDSLTIMVEEECGKSATFIPNAFSPNGDGVNDLLIIRNNCIRKFTLIIYDRWGMKIFETSNLNDGWDGSFNGKQMNTAVFDYYFTAEMKNGDHIDQKGTIQLIR